MIYTGKIRPLSSCTTLFPGSRVSIRWGGAGGAQCFVVGPQVLEWRLPTLLEGEEARADVGVPCPQSPPAETCSQLMASAHH